jgi:1,4-alpha-glucan branching enzyme
MKKGGFTFVLHSHLPYTRLAGRWPHGEETIHECAAETYIPLLNALHDLREEGVKYQLTIGITPVLTEQISDPTVLEHLVEYLELRIAAAENDIERYSAEGMTRTRKEREAEERRKAATDPNISEAVTALAEAAAKVAGVLINTNEPDKLDEPDPRHSLAKYYRDWYTYILESFKVRFKSDMIGAFRQLQDEGYIEIITSAATHGYLPLMHRDSTIYGQLRVGIESYKKHFGREPRAIWLPECAYRPAYYATDAQGKQYYKPGLEEFLKGVGLHCFFVETHTVEGGVPVGKAAADDEVIGPYSFIQREYVIPHAQELPDTHRSTFQPYWVQGEDVAVMGRNNAISMQVWSSKNGYPGDKDYREFHKKDDGSGLQYWRVSGPDIDLGHKDFYNPDWTTYRVDEHSDHFVKLVEQEIRNYYKSAGKHGIICANYDTELFGHWWFEGVNWIKAVLRKLSTSDTVELTGASHWLKQYPPDEIIAIPESSWGKNGTHITWWNEETEWMWGPIHAAERRMERLIELVGDVTDANMKLVMEQATRELLLLESSDWPFLVTTVQAADYATERFKSHELRFNELASYLEQTGGNPKLLDKKSLAKAKEYFDKDNIFPELDYSVFAEREKRSQESG